MRFLLRLFVIFSLLVIVVPTFAQNSTLYTDPSEQFSIQLPDGFTVDESSNYITIKSPDDGLIIYMMALENADLNQALIDAWAIANPDFDATDFDPAMVQTIEEPAQLDGYEKALVITYELDTTKADGKVVQGVVLLFEGMSYVALYDTNISTAQQRAAQIQVINSSFKPTSKATETVADAEVATWNDDLTQELEAFITDAMPKLDVAGLAIGIVQDGELVYANGFGKANENGDVVNADTRMIIASTTKSMTTLLMAQTVDEGKMAWDTPVTDIMPSFAVADDDITAQFVVENLVCACTGVPRRDFELIMNNTNLTAQGIVESLKTFEFYTGFGETFQYSNQLVATGGYVTAMANGVTYDNLLDGYVELMNDNVFSPLGMTRTTFDFDTVTSDDNYADPYGADLLQYTPIEVNSESWLLNLAPAGGAWSTVNDLSKYVIMELNKGVNADGTRVVSEENLTYTWQPQVQLNATTSYGFGWIISDYKGVQLISHGGNSLGFSSELMFAPDKGFGLIVLVNQQGSAIPSLVQARFLELLFGEEDKTTAQVTLIDEARQTNLAEALEEVDTTVDPALVENYLGTFSNDTLGDFTLAYDGETLLADFGEFTSAIYYGVDVPDAEATPDTEATPELAEPKTAFLLGQSPLAGVELKLEEKDGQFTITIGAGLLEYVFVKQ